MTIEGAFVLIAMAMVVLLAAGGLASYIEGAVYRAIRDSGEAPPEQLDRTYSELRLAQAKLRDQKAQLDDRLAKLQKERASLLDQERRMADRNNNLVAEAGYPAPGSPGYYLKLEGPAAAMPFAGLASLQLPIGGRRQVRLVVWGVGPVEARNIAETWAGEEARVTVMREFSGKLYWQEA